MRLGTKVGRSFVVVLALAGMLSVAAPAQGFIIIECRLAATATQTAIDEGTPATYDWDVVMTGECGGDSKGRYAAFGSADGTSLGLGLCDGSLVMQNLDLDVFLFLDSVRGPQFSKLLHERWSAAVTTYPVATPFLVEDVSGPAPALVGAGVLTQHLMLDCSPNANPSTLILRVALK
jgi:hypothetical protein